jgi:hypothetical protein
VIWRGLTIGRIMRASGAPHDKPKWTWNCYLGGRPVAASDSGTGVDLDDCKGEVSDDMGAHPSRAHR